MSDALEVLKEVKATATLQTLHPLKLDRWHRALLGLPDAIYMQYGAQQLLQQVLTAAGALRGMVDLLGPSGLPVAPQELCQRQVQTFRWFVPMGNHLVQFQSF